MTALIIFISHPERGRVMLRLAKEVGEEAALRIHEQLLNHTRSITENFPGEKFLYYAEYPNWNDAWNINTYRKRVQQGADIAERIGAAFESVFEEGHDRAIMIGSDCYELSEEIIRQGAEALSDHDVVFGPAQAGDCYLLGMKGLHPAAFSNIPWGTGDVQAQLRYVLAEMGLSWHELPMLLKIHTAEDLTHSGMEIE